MTQPTPKRGDKKTDAIGTIKLLAFCDGYCFVRRPGCIPFVMTANDWEKCSPEWQISDRRLVPARGLARDKAR